LGGKPEISYSQNDSFGGCEAVAEVQFNYKKCIGNVKLSWLEKLPCTYSIRFEKATIEGEVYDFSSFKLTTQNGIKKRLKVKCVEKYYHDFGEKIVSNFLDVITNGTRPLISGSDIADSVEIIDECYETASRFALPWYEIQEKADEK
jgi:predicted dehydrogenase